MRTSSLGGAERLIIDYLNNIDYSALQVTWAVHENNFSKERAGNSSLAHVEILPRKDPKNGWIKDTIIFWKFVSSQKPDMVIINQFSMASFWFIDMALAFLACKGNVTMIVHDCIPLLDPYVRKLHFGIFPTLGLVWGSKYLGRRLMAYVSRKVIAVSSQVQEMLVRMYRYPEKSVSVIYHGVDTKRFSPVEDCFKRELRKKFGVPADVTVLVSTARFDAFKRVDLLISVFRSFAGARQDIWLVLAGDGPDEPLLHSQVSSMDPSLRSRICFLGFMGNVEEALQMSDIYVLPSYTEGMPLALLEAMSCGLIAVVTNSGGPSEVVSNRVNGFLVGKDETDILAGLHEALRLTPEQAADMSAQARKTIEERFSLQDTIKQAFDCIGLPMKLPS